MAIKIHEYFMAVQRPDRKFPLLAFCTSKLTDDARRLIEQHLLSLEIPNWECGAVWRFDLDRRTGALRAHGWLIAGR